MIISGAKQNYYYAITIDKKISDRLLISSVLYKTCLKNIY